MKTFIRHSLLLSALVLGAVLTLGGMAGDAHAYKRQTTVTGQNGKSASKNVDANRTEDGYSRNATTTGPGGQSVSKSSSGSWDSSTKTWNKNKSVTGPGGQSKSWQKSTTVTPQ